MAYRVKYSELSTIFTEILNHVSHTLESNLLFSKVIVESDRVRTFHRSYLVFFLNDLEEYMRNLNCNGISLNTPGYDIDTYLKILVLLYADDTVVFGTDADLFQHNLNVFYDYTQQWKLNINFRKTKILIFGVRNTNNFQFKLGNNTIDICDEFKYLGVVFTKH